MDAGRRLSVTLMAGILLGIGGGFSLNITNQTLDGVSVTPTNAAINVNLQTDGDYVGTESGSGGFAPADQWVIPKAGLTSSDFEAQLTVTSGDSPSSGSSVGSWLNLGSALNWNFTTSTVELRGGTWTVELGLAGTSTAVISATVIWTADETL